MGEKAKTLLILEEGEKLSKAVAPAFEKAGWELITYRDPTGVLVMAKQIEPDVMLIDANLRSHGAASALRSFARNLHMAGVPIIALVGRTGPQEKELRAAGAVACVKDPPDPNEILSLAERYRLQELDFSQSIAAAPPAAPSKPAPAAQPAPAAAKPEHIPLHAPDEVLAEPARLEALKETAVMDSPPDPSYDRVTRLASRLLGAPVSLASFVAADRQFFKSDIGLAGKWKERRGTPLSHSFCQWVVSSREPVIIDDARRHRVLRSNAAVDDLGVVAYAGVPVVARAGQPIGSMCAIDHVTRNWTPEDVKTLQDLAQVLQAYAVKDRERSREAIQAATRLLLRHGEKMGPPERADLVGIIDDQTARLA